MGDELEIHRIESQDDKYRGAAVTKNGKILCRIEAGQGSDLDYFIAQYVKGLIEDSDGFIRAAVCREILNDQVGYNDMPDRVRELLKRQELIAKNFVEKFDTVVNDVFTEMYNTK